MSNNKEAFFTVKRGIIILILYSITIIVYFTFFYKPLELLYPNVGIIVNTNKTLKSINRDNIMFFFIFSLLGVVIFLMITTIIYDQILLCTKPIIEVNARLKSKELVMQRSGDYLGFSNIGYTYSLTFEVDNGDLVTFPVYPKYYYTIIERNRGGLKYKQGRVKKFEGFDFTSID
ncbi:DUF2500 family protein [Clostridium sp.]|uniref:DUF2500 family protein n=1 Tax=Clostridium sp. TaxID=1506 RepID=UPI003EE8ACC4